MKKLISLGYNCEVTFQIQRFLGKADTSLFSWAYILDDDKFLEALENIEDVFTHEVHFHAPTDDMFYDEAYHMTFHGRTPKHRLFDEEGNIRDRALYDSALEELRSRVQHLKEKTLRDFDSGDEKFYFRKLLIRPEPDGTVNWEKPVAFARKLDGILRSRVAQKRYRLFLVVEAPYLSGQLKALESDTLSIRSVAAFAPDADTNLGADYPGWVSLFREALLTDLYPRVEAKQYDELKAWTDELAGGKQWLENQYHSLTQEVNRLQMENSLLRRELEEKNALLQARQSPMLNLL